MMKQIDRVEQRVDVVSRREIQNVIDSCEIRLNDHNFVGTCLVFFVAVFNILYVFSVKTVVLPHYQIPEYDEIESDCGSFSDSESEWENDEIYAEPDIIAEINEEENAEKEENSAGKN
jgi:hypothetical protein